MGAANGLVDDREPLDGLAVVSVTKVFDVVMVPLIKLPGNVSSDLAAWFLKVDCCRPRFDEVFARFELQRLPGVFY